MILESDLKLEKDSAIFFTESYLTRLFNKIGSNENGKITYQKLHNFIRDYDSIFPQRIRNVIKQQAKLKGSEEINLSEFTSFINKQKYSNPFEKYLNIYMKFLIPPPQLPQPPEQLPDVPKKNERIFYSGEPEQLKFLQEKEIEVVEKEKEVKGKKADGIEEEEEIRPAQFILEGENQLFKIPSETRIAMKSFRPRKKVSAPFIAPTSMMMARGFLEDSEEGGIKEEEERMIEEEEEKDISPTHSILEGENRLFKIPSETRIAIKSFHPRKKVSTPFIAPTSFMMAREFVEESEEGGIKEEEKRMIEEEKEKEEIDEEEQEKIYLKTIMEEAKDTDSLRRIYHFWPLPLGMILISLADIILYSIDVANGYDWKTGHIAKALIYDPSRRIQMWRYFSYMFVHSGNWHLSMNVIFQLILGFPLELHYTWLPVTIVYSSGVIAGALGSSVTSSHAWLGGASGGVYALITTHIVVIIMNWKRMNHSRLLILIFVLYVFIDALRVVVNYLSENLDTSISYSSHFFGGLTGLLIGTVVFKSFDYTKNKEKTLIYILVAISIILVLAAVVYNIFAWNCFPEQKVWF